MDIYSIIIIHIHNIIKLYIYPIFYRYCALLPNKKNNHFTHYKGGAYSKKVYAGKKYLW